MDGDTLPLPQLIDRLPTTVLSEDPRFMRIAPLTLAFACALQVSNALADPVISQPGKDPSLTLYPGGYGLIHEARPVTLEKGPNEIALQGLPSAIRADSVLASGVELTIQKRLFDFGAITREALLQHSLGKTIGILKTNPQTGEEREEEAKVLSIRNGLVLQVGGRIVTGTPGRLLFKEIPEGLRAEPALTLIAESAKGGKQNLGLTYLTGGLGWRATYVAQINQEGTALDLKGFAELTNSTGRTYENARLRLVAGDVRPPQTTALRPQLMRAKAAGAMMMAESEPAPDAMQRTGTGQQHIYAVPGTVTLTKHQTQQVALLGADNIPAKTEYHFNSGVYRQPLRGTAQIRRAEVRLKFKNDKASGLDAPLPAGNLRAFRGTGADTLFGGEVFLNRKAAGEDVALSLGQAFDVTLKRSQTDFDIKDPKGRDRTFEAAWKLDLSNAHDKPVTVVVKEAFSGQWEMLETTHEPTKSLAGAAHWTLTLKPGQKETIAYRARVVPR